MKAEFKLDNPESCSATMIVTMSLRDWIELHDHIDNKIKYHWSVDNFKSLIGELIDKSRKEYSESIKKG